MKVYKNIFADGVIYKNPVLVQVLGTCPVLATGTSLKNALGMGICVIFVLMGSNLIISLLRKFIPDKIRIASFILVIAGFVSVIEMLVKAFLPALSQSLGIFIPLIVVNCIILGRAESFASKNRPLPSLLDGFATGIGFTLAICILGSLREFLGAGSIWGIRILPENYTISMLTMVPGGFLVFGMLIALMQFIMSKRGNKQ